MRFSALKSVGHNIAHSLASGIGEPIGIWFTKVFDEASAAPQGYVEVDFVGGTTSGSPCSLSLREAVALYSEKVLPDLCSKHGVDPNEVRAIRARFEVTGRVGPQFTVTVENSSGKRSVNRYIGFGGDRARFATREG